MIKDQEDRVGILDYQSVYAVEVKFTRHAGRSDISSMMNFKPKKISRLIGFCSILAKNTKPWKMSG